LPAVGSRASFESELVLDGQPALRAKRAAIVRDARIAPSRAARDSYYFQRFGQFNTDFPHKTGSGN